MITYPPAPRRSGFVGPMDGGPPSQAARRPQRRVVVRLWLPMTLIFLLLAPFALLLAPFVWFAPPPYGERPFATVLGIGRLLLSLGGTVVEVEAPEALIHIRVF
jgi:hypothetical protein